LVLESVHGIEWAREAAGVLVEELVLELLALLVLLVLLVLLLPQLLRLE